MFISLSCGPSEPRRISNLSLWAIGLNWGVLEHAMPSCTASQLWYNHQTFGTTIPLSMCNSRSRGSAKCVTKRDTDSIAGREEPLKFSSIPQWSWRVRILLCKELHIWQSHAQLLQRATATNHNSFGFCKTHSRIQDLHRPTLVQSKQQNIETSNYWNSLLAWQYQRFSRGCKGSVADAMLFAG